MVSQHIRSNVVGYLAVFLALTGTATALEGKGSVKSKDIAKGAVTTQKLRGQAVSAAKLGNGAVTGAKLAAGAVGGTDIAAGAVGSGAIAPGAVTAEKLAPGVIDGGIADGAITTDKLANGAVTNPKLGSQAVDTGQLANGAVETAQIANGAVDTAQLAAFAVESAALGTGAVTAEKIATGTITGTQLDKDALALGPDSFGALPVLKVFGQLAQTAPAIAPTTVALDTGNIEVNSGGFTVDADSAAVPIDGLYYARLVVPWGSDSAAAERQFVAMLQAGGDLVDTASARSSQSVGFNYGPSTDPAGIVDLQAGDEISGEVYYSGATPAGEIPLAGLGLTTLEVFWLGPG